MKLKKDLLITYGADSSVIIWKLPNFDIVYDFQMLSRGIQHIDAEKNLAIIATIDKDHTVGVYCWITRRKLSSFEISCTENKRAYEVKHHICVCNCGLLAISSEGNDSSEIELYDFYGKNFGKTKVLGKILNMKDIINKQYENYLAVGTSHNSIYIFSLNDLSLVKKNSEPVNGEFFYPIKDQRQILTLKSTKLFKSLTVLNY